MKFAQLRITFALLTMMVLVLACGAPAASSEDPAATEAAVEAAATEDAAATESAPPAEIPAIQHNDIPVSLPEKQSGEAGDFNSSNILENKTPIGGDRFTFGRFERPFNANAMDTYFPELDIIYTQVFQDDLWIYGRVYFNELSASSSTAQYAVELDTNLNGKAEWLIVAGKPASTEWTVEGVRVYQDANGNVGGELPTLTDNVPANSDGFETTFFDQGTGDNPDTAWVRISPEDPNIIEFALNRAALQDTAKYLINFWAGSNIDPAKFDLNDAYTHEQAGAADNGLQNFYPIKELAEIDNSCRMAVGFQPTGKEPGLCDTYVKQQEAAAPSAGGGGCTSTPGQVLACVAFPPVSYSCSWNSSNCSCDCEYTGPK